MYVVAMRSHALRLGLTCCLQTGGMQNGGMQNGGMQMTNGHDRYRGQTNQSWQQ